jgi:hypothetical protein
VTVALDARALGGGTYTGSILVLSNDPEAAMREHPVTLQVTDAPAIAASPPLLDFGTVFAGFAAQGVVTVRNTGTAPLHVAAAGAGAAAIAAIGAPMTLAPGASGTLSVIWSPVSPAPLDATLALTSDAANVATLVVPLRGTAVAPPALGVVPASLVETVQSGNAVTRTLTLANSGTTRLDFRVRAVSGPAGGSAAVFERLADSPVPVTCLEGDPDAGLVYCQESQGVRFLRYRMSGGTWEPLATALFAPGEDAGAALLRGRLYVGYASRNSTIGVYDIAARSWTTRASPLGLGTSARAGSISWPTPPSCASTRCPDWSRACRRPRSRSVPAGACATGREACSVMPASAPSTWRATTSRPAPGRRSLR